MGYVFGVGPRACMGKQISEALLPAVVGAILRRYRVEPADSAWYAKRMGEQRGQLNYPVNPPLLCWKRRDTDQSQRPSSEQQQQSQLQSVFRERVRQHVEPCLQPRGLREQDSLRLGHLVSSQGQREK